MKKYIVGWILNALVTIGTFFCSCIVLGLIIGFYYRATGAGVESLPSDQELANDGLFGVFCFLVLLGSNFFGYYITVKKYVNNE